MFMFMFMFIIMYYNSHLSLVLDSPQDFNAITDQVLSFGNGTPVGGQICEVISIVNDSIEEPNDEVFSIDISNPVFLLQDITLQFPNVFVTISDCKNLVV